MPDDLIETACAARSRAYAPYSRFAVGAALRCEGVIHAGCNVENAAYPQGSCAEAGAIAAMVLHGGRHIEEIVIAGGGDAPCTPCGGCRQRLREFGAPDMRIRIVDPEGRVKLETTLGSLLPWSFGPDNLTRTI
ncbi:cytidine deaminase [Swaminathania salitolerans]|uniref:Cytidine deaminase n=1 Tax=Swaminathania salitolerans TaxID=182838 RepID=A0A511BNE4_9PROT|nr:cytidine deaminase [Swaminathania salitolerans]GBQ16052.1 cytidine deaminase [Swaminathania salitolerans LMG 21291]GEL01582.1 cytidine deaminase [Swaminathania salitolerans]